jgi:hypothetical protein
MAVVGAHQVRLRSTAHPPYVLDSFHRHGAKIVLGFQYHQPWAFSTKARKILETQRKGVNGGVRKNEIEIPTSSDPSVPLRFKVFAELRDFQC